MPLLQITPSHYNSQVSKSGLVVVGTEAKCKEEGEGIEDVLLYKQEPL